MSEYQYYRRTGLSLMRPYVPGEDMAGISISKGDTPELGGMIAKSPRDETDRWYVSKAYFENTGFEVVEPKELNMTKWSQ